MEEGVDSEKSNNKNVGGPTNLPGSATTSFADMFKDKTHKKIVKISEMRNEQYVEGANVAIPSEAVDEVRSRFANTLYGYFIGKRLVFPIVENYVRNT